MKTILILSCALIVSFTVQSQEAIAASGGEAVGSGGTFSYTLGQVFYTATSGSNGTISHGIQKSIELFALSNPALTSVNLEAVIYPNPTSDYVMLNINDNIHTNLSYVLLDIQGKVVSNAKINTIDTRVSLQGLSAGTYVFKVNQKNSELKTFKIIKK
jgi:hypothetical protein